MSTKEKILHHSLLIFNEKGVGQVSALQISQALGMSYGNLTYHFKNKEAIVLALYRQMQEALEAAIAKTVQHIFEETFYLNLVNQLFEVTWKYRFIYLNLSSLMLQYRAIGDSEKAYAERRYKILTKANEYLIREGYLKPEIDIEYQLTIHNLSLILYSWILDAQLFHPGKEKEKIQYYTALFYNATIPCLTPKGLKKLNQLRAKTVTG